MRESDFLAPLGIVTLLASLKGLQNRQDAQTAYANEVERLNQLALESQEETEDISPEPQTSFSSNLENYFSPGIQDSELKETSDNLSSMFNLGPEFFGVNVMQALFPQLMLADQTTQGGLEELDNLVEMGADPMGSALYLSKGATIPGLDNELGFKDGGLINLFETKK
jgi:hypothetical protein|tara:strand:- start:370 stop:873 length:504 start_codon:yes stop_codon:yes gene_type:complete